MEQRFSFDQIADAYRAARPDYPEALVQDVVAYAELNQEDRILEVGCGTGQATKSFASRGFPIVAIDPGPELLRGARESLAAFGNVEFLESTFEAWPANRGGFRLIIAAQSWHWVSPDVRFAKAAASLSAGGSLAVFGHVPVGLPAPSVARFKEIYLRQTGKWGPPPEAWYLPNGPFKGWFEESGYSGRLSTEDIHGSGDIRRQAIRFSCARNRSTGSWNPRNVKRCSAKLPRRLTIRAGRSPWIMRRISMLLAGWTSIESFGRPFPGLTAKASADGRLPQPQISCVAKP